MNKSKSFKKKLIASAVASYAMAGFSMHAFADDAVEEVVVTGIKASLIAAMDIKRNAVGVVDAINAEDIGKMPDSNLAESLQRISGLSISRNNGEGSQVTVRGIDPSLNMVTLNGRVMPAVSNGSTGDNASRAYDFSNLASETINGVEVYKTGRADLAAGGMGATINVKTLRPLDAGNKATFGLKAVDDESLKNGTAGSRTTPEASGLYSWVNEDKNFGVSLDGAYQVRDSARSSAFVNNWQPEVMKAGFFPSTATVTNGPAIGQLFNLPTDLRYQLENIERTRKNAQLTLQFRPIENLTGTLDYTYSENQITSARSQQSTWYNISAISNISFDNGTVKSPLIYQETYPGGGKDVSFAQESFDTNTKNNSFGFNLAYQASDSLKLELDFHNSSAESLTHDAQAGLNANVVTANYADFSKGLPVMGISMDDSGAHGNGNGVLDGGDMSGAMGTIAMAHQRTTIEQLQLKGAYSVGDFGGFTNATVDFGFDERKNTNLSLAGSGGNRITMGNWGGVNPTEFGSDWPGYFTPRNFGNAFPDSTGSTSDPHFLKAGMTAKMSQIAQKMEYMFASKIDPANFNGFPNGKFEFNGIIDTNREVDEDVQSFFVQFKSGFELAGKPANVLGGVRYEKTDVTAIGSVNPPTKLQWDSDNDWTTISSTTGSVPIVVKRSYDNILPNVDFDVAVTDDVKLRASYSETMGRPSYQQMGPVTTLTSVYYKTASSGNPGLKPMESKNLDLAVEWYYSKDSYLSAGVFSKDVSNYIGNSVVAANWYGLRDVRSGPRFAKAVAELTAARAAGVTAVDYSSGGKAVLADPTNEAQQWTQILKDMGVASPSPSNGDKIYADANDPLMSWATTEPTNNKSARIHGAELGVQHWFGESGFGVQANYTKVSADVGFDITQNPTATQFAMIGLSDSANVVGMYEKDAWKARIAYNWRDKFLNSATWGGGNEPSFTRAFGEIDFSISYQLNSNVTFSVDGLNVTGANSLNYGRSETQVNVYEDLSPRYTAGVRYTF